MEFQLNVSHTAENEAGLNTFLVFIKDSYPTVITGATADSEFLKCGATLVFEAYTDAVTAVGAIKSAFTIHYKLQVNP